MTADQSQTAGAGTGFTPDRLGAVEITEKHREREIVVNMTNWEHTQNNTTDICKEYIVLHRAA